MLFVDPGRASGSSPKKTRYLCVGFWGVNTIALCILLVTRLSQALGSAVFPTGYVVPGVRFNCFVQLYIFTSSTVATLGKSGWLDLPQWGLAPHKKRHASLGALTPILSGRPHTVAFRIQQEPQQGPHPLQGAG
jgi:hypothetical protein